MIFIYDRTTISSSSIIQLAINVIKKSTSDAFLIGNDTLLMLTDHYISVHLMGTFGFNIDGRSLLPFFPQDDTYYYRLQKRHYHFSFVLINIEEGYGEREDD